MEYTRTPTTWGRFNYREIAEPERLVWLNSFANEHCGIARAPFSELCPFEIHNTVTFGERDGTTVMSLHAEPIGETSEERTFFEELCTSRSLETGYAGTCEALDAFLARHTAKNAGLNRMPAWHVAKDGCEYFPPIRRAAVCAFVPARRRHTLEDR